MKIKLQYNNDYCGGSFLFGNTGMFRVNPVIRLREFNEGSVEIGKEIRHGYVNLCRRLKLKTEMF